MRKLGGAVEQGLQDGDVSVPPDRRSPVRLEEGIAQAVPQTARRVVELAALYPDRAELLREFPELENEDIRQALLYASLAIEDQGIAPALIHEAAS